MYTTCLFCQAPLGANEVIEHFPVGRRLAFDGGKGRLWVVCRACHRWNLSALEERWEAIEECERSFRGTRLRVSTEQIGLARLPEGLELVRVGRPQRPEMAAWRYGSQLVRRRNRYLVIGGVASAAGLATFGGLAMTGVLGGGSYWIYSMAHSFWQKHQNRKVVHRLSPEHSPTGSDLVIRRWHVQGARLGEAADGTVTLHVPDATRKDPKTDGWGRRKYSDEEVVLSGADAHGVLRRSMVHVNSKGASRSKVQEAVRLLGEAPSADGYLRQLARSSKVLGKRPKMEKDRLSFESALALEMALNEEAERQALEGELSLLERAWQEAEEIAAIADTLALPPAVDRLMHRLRLR